MTRAHLRIVAAFLSALSAGAMLYVGLYQSRRVDHLWCPLNAKGCEAVADAAFARPFGVPDGYIGTALYACIVLLLLVPVERHRARVALLALGALAVVANVVGVYDMARLGCFCTYCLLTTAAAPLLLWALWRLQLSPRSGDPRDR